MILVTGGLGTIGAQTARALIDLGQEVIVTRRHNAHVPAFLADRVTVEPLDVTDRDAFLDVGERHEITGIVHLAAGGLEVIDDPMEFLRVNTTGLLNALEAARTWDVGRFAVASSIGSYAGRPETVPHEDLPLPTVPPSTRSPRSRRPPRRSPRWRLPAPASTRSCSGSARSGDRSPTRPRRSSRSPRSSTPWPRVESHPSCTPMTAATAATAPTRVARSHCS